jgi:hypothetical protein
MSPDNPRKPKSNPSREERSAKALRENLARRKALVRAKRSRAETEPAGAAETPSAGAELDGDLDTQAAAEGSHRKRSR